MRDLLTVLFVRLPRWWRTYRRTRQQQTVSQGWLAEQSRRKE